MKSTLSVLLLLSLFGTASLPAQSTQVRVSVSHMAISTLRAVAKRAPESAGLYTIRVCNLSPLPVSVQMGHIHQGIEGTMGLAVIPKALADATIRRSRSMGLSVAAKTAEVAGKWVAPIVLSIAAGGTIDLSGWQAGALAAATVGLRIVDDATKEERDMVAASVTKLGLAWSSEFKGGLMLDPSQCTPDDPPIVFLGSYRRGQPETTSFILGDSRPAPLPPAPAPVAPPAPSQAPTRAPAPK
jgi:hypothetical protein